MNASERNYSACEREALVVTFAIKKFRVHLLSAEHFTIVTGHQALQYAFKKKDVHGRLARWLDTLAEHEFAIQYHPGILNGAADYLSRNPLAPESQCTMNCQSHDAHSCAVAMSAIAQENDAHGWENFLEDAFCYLHGREMEEEDPKVKKSTRRGAKRYLAWNELLFQRTPKGLRMVPPKPIDLES